MAKSTKTVVFIDPNVTDWQNLVNGVEPGSLVFIIDQTRDGIRQITDKLAALTDIDSVQIISHGGEGSLSLGSTQLNSATLNSYSSQLQQWGQSLTTTGDILLYGCDVAGGVIGKAFVQQISQLTGADVAASDDLTGSAALGGDWLLEYATGLIEAPLALQIQAMEAYTAVLPNTTLFAPYVDVTLWPTPDIAAISQATGVKIFNLAFINEDSLTAGVKGVWGGYSTYDPGTGWYKDKITALRAIGGDVIFGFGGAIGTEIAQAATTVAQAQTAYKTIIDTYGANNGTIRLNFDIEGAAVADSTSNNRRNQALYQLQQSYASQGINISVSLTLPVLPTGLDSSGLNIVQSALTAGVKLDYVNVMAMDYGDSAAPITTQKTMGYYAIQAAQSTEAQIKTAYQNIGVTLTDAQAWAKIGVTPMIGVNDVPTEKFTQADATQLADFANTVGMGMTSFWSINRDQPSPAGGGPLYQYSNIPQQTYEFSQIFFNATNNITPPTITLAVSPSSVLENGPNNLIYTFTRTEATTNALTVNYGVTGTADSSDYTGATPGTGKTITFAAGASTATLTIDPTGDSTPESDETVVLTLASGTGYTVGTTTAVTGTITNDDVVASPSITLAVSPSSVLENGTTNLIYTFTRTKATTNALTVNYGVTGTADSSDYTGATPGTGKTITFAAGASTATLTIDPTGDSTPESNETVVLTLASGTGYTVGTTTTVTGTITNDDIVASPSITLAVSPGSVLEDGTANLIYTFTRTGTTTNALTVNYGVAGTAIFNNDYTQIGAVGFTPTTGTITFAAGSSTKTLTIDPTGDSTVESNETVALTLTTGTGYTIGTTTAVTGTITNDDVVASPSITLAVSPSSVLENGTTNLIYTFTRTGATTNALTVNYNVAGTATFNNDYTQIGAATFTATTGTITFAAGSSTKTLTIDPTADTTVESNETVALTLTTGTGYTIGTTTAVTGTITNDDTTGPLTLTGDATSNNLVGGSGNDTFLGMGGNDTLTGGLGADRFRFNSPSDGMDTITDFSKADGDKIELFGIGFNSLVWTDGVSNALAPSVFSVGTSANSWTNSIIYNNSNGIVYFDADALGSGSQVALAQLSPGLNLTNQDFIVSWV
ncbi:DUF4347 domain-containing protein [Dolichospermum planctonicum]|uniref:GH18 domain-containing protein n=1 Tax=Dolichospermum planctonicum TaxID=136072 RepID=A0A480AEU1_9CYAN|nr:DUF4347 domain-containing protein [Dolichospermum planctonicum]GCL43650.1 hypothetical protein NIES80_33680 [Dolichospermum planctonicum]